MQYQWVRLCVPGLVVTIYLTISGCSSGSGHSDGPVVLQQNLTLTGSVGDGPIVNADVTVVDASDEVVATTTSDAFAKYQVVVPAGTRYPLTVRVAGGTDLVTNREPDFSLETTVANTTQTVVNVSPLSHLTQRVGACLGRVPYGERHARAWQLVSERVGMGFDVERFGDPTVLPVAADNVAAVVLANEGLGEIVRRTRDALQSTAEPKSADEVIDAVACDLAADGIIDGRGGASSPRLAATFWASSTSVLLETMGKRLQVDGADATSRMDDAIAAVLSGAAGAATATTPVTPSLVRQTREAVAVLQAEQNDAVLVRYAVMLDTLPIYELQASVAQALDGGDLAALSQFSTRLANADSAVVESSVTAVRAFEVAPQPVMSFSANPSEVAAGGTVQLSWASAAVDSCMASGGWTGAQPSDGVMDTPPLNSPTRYRLDCSGAGGSVSAEVMVGVTGMTAPALPSVDLAASAATVEAGGNVTLSWSAKDATDCAATGAWSGARALAGSESVGPLTADSTFALTCSGAGGSSKAVVSVTVTPAAAPTAPAPDPTPAPDPAPAPAAPVSVTLTASPSWVDLGAAAQLSWNSSGATGCTASGGWSGTKSTSGTTSVGPISSDSSFSLVCTGAGGNALATTSVSVRSARLSWQAPAGTTFSGFRIHYGTAPGNYDQTVDLTDPSVRSHVIGLAPGSYYFSMAAVDAAGAETARSNEVSKSIQ